VLSTNALAVPLWSTGAFVSYTTVEHHCISCTTVIGLSQRDVIAGRHFMWGYPDEIRFGVGWFRSSPWMRSIRYQYAWLRMMWLDVTY